MGEYDRLIEAQLRVLYAIAKYKSVCGRMCPFVVFDSLKECGCHVGGELRQKEVEHLKVETEEGGIVGSDVARTG